MGLVALTAACGNDKSPEGVAAATTTSSGAAPPSAKATTTVVVKGFAFDPKVATVKAGQTVTWTNEDSSDHAIHDKANAFVGEHFGPGAGRTTYSHSYNTRGEFEYYCDIHNSMTGLIVVT